jgi:hypothetical protein
VEAGAGQSDKRFDHEIHQIHKILWVWGTLHFGLRVADSGLKEEEKMSHAKLAKAQRFKKEKEKNVSRRGRGGRRGLW